MIRYQAGGRSAATAATADQSGAALWNASTAKSIYCVEFHCFKTTATADNHQLIRTTNRGTTPGSTVTPDIDNDHNRAIAPVSGALLDLAAWATYPTVAGPPMARSNLPAAIGAGFMWIFGGDGIAIPQSTGLAIGTPVATILQASDFTAVWDE